MNCGGLMGAIGRRAQGRARGTGSGRARGLSDGPPGARAGRSDRADGPVTLARGRANSQTFPAGSLQRNLVDAFLAPSGQAAGRQSGFAGHYGPVQLTRALMTHWPTAGRVLEVQLARRSRSVRALLEYEASDLAQVERPGRSGRCRRCRSRVQMAEEKISPRAARAR